MFLKGGNIIIMCQTSSRPPAVIFLKTCNLDKEATVFHHITGHDAVCVAVASSEVDQDLN